MTIFFRSRFFL